MPTAFTVSELVSLAADRLAAAGVDAPRLDAELLLAQALHVDRAGLLAYPEAPVGDGARETFEASVTRRERGEPVAYIRGFREFHGLAFATDSRALIPRPETELLVDAALEEVAARLAATPRVMGVPALRIADVGTGTGAIAVSLLAALRRRKMADEVLVIAIDVSEDALQLARENAVGHGVADRMVFMAADLLPYHVDPPYTVVCANLPYVPTGDIAGLARELSFEPALALDGGPDGLDVVRRLLDALPRTLATDGVAFLEIGAGHGEAIAHEVSARLPGWRCRVTDDLAGLPRLARVEPADPGVRP
ncbi:MAG TPA: peptide chain release factor N(5)-glutamine methyltransferase [Candidatus Limnocylindrales bacterium]|jgi:release factor glutamine methyltransferase